MAGTQNLQNTAQNYQNNDNNYNDSNQTDDNNEQVVKGDFLKTPNSQSNDKLNSDSFDQDSGASPTDSPVNQIQNMTREAGDGQNDTSNEIAE